MGRAGVLLTLQAALVAGCASAAPEVPAVDLTETRFLSEELVRVVVTIDGTPEPAVLRRALDCGAVELAALQQFAFARHVRTAVTEEGGVRRADAVYTVSKDLPRGVTVLDVAVQAEACGELEETGVIANDG